MCQQDPLLPGPLDNHSTAVNSRRKFIKNAPGLAGLAFAGLPQIAGAATGQ